MPASAAPVDGRSDSSTSGPTPPLFVHLEWGAVATNLLQEMSLHKCTRCSSVVRGAVSTTARDYTSHDKPSDTVANFDIRHLPFREDVLEFIRGQRSLGRKIILTTRGDPASARSIAEELGCFDGVLASDIVHSFRGDGELEAIRSYCRDHGHSEFDYLGDSEADLPIWRAARRAYLVAPTARLLRQVREFTEPAEILGYRRSPIRAAIAALRPHQWVKNILVFVPLVTSHTLFHLPTAIAALVAFACFCLCASAVYVLNDLADIGADRCHPTKRSRPFASGALPVSCGIPLSGGLLLLGFAISLLLLPYAFSAVLAFYFITTCAYSFFAKRIAMLDVLVLAGLYTIRVIAGGAATGIVVSEWLMAFSMFLFVSLAFAKRYAELERLQHATERAPNGRGYRIADIGLIEGIGPASGYIAVLVLALYVNAHSMRLLYGNPWPLWLLCPVLMYWISRVWLIAKRGELSEDPIVFALHDRVSFYLGLLVVGLLVMASVVHT